MKKSLLKQCGCYPAYGKNLQRLLRTKLFIYEWVWSLLYHVLHPEKRLCIESPGLLLLHGWI